jgi:hypothetical protein
MFQEKQAESSTASTEMFNCFVVIFVDKRIWPLQQTRFVQSIHNNSCTMFKNESTKIIAGLIVDKNSSELLRRQIIFDLFEI